MRSFIGVAWFIFVHRYIDWCSSAAHSILHFPSLSLSLSPMLLQAPLSLPIMLCSSSKSDATCLCVPLLCRFFCRDHNEVSHIVVYFNCYILYMLLLIIKRKWKGRVSVRVHYYHFTIHYLQSPPCLFFCFFFPGAASCRKQTAAACELICT